MSVLLSNGYLSHPAIKSWINWNTDTEGAQKALDGFLSELLHET